MLSKNISLRPLDIKDVPLILEWINDSDVSHHFRFESSKMTIERVIDFIRNSEGDTEKHFAIVDDTDEYLGTVSLKNIDLAAKSAEYAIVLRKKAQGTGCGYQATSLILDYAYYTLGLERVYFNVFSDNEKAVRFYERFGFIYEGEFINHISVRGELRSIKWFRMMKGEYEAIRNRNAYTINDVKTLEFPELGDARGHLVVLESNQTIPFEVRRIFYIYGSDSDVVRGQHANRHSSFCLINVCGTSKVKVIDSTGKERIFVLDRPHIGIYLPPMIWKDMYDFSSDSILLVLSDRYYDNGEYIRDFDEFTRFVEA